MRLPEPLSSLRSEAIALAARSSIGPEEVAAWRGRTLAALEEVYGQGSSPVQDFLRIQFDDAAIINTAEEVLRDKAAEEGIDLDPLKIRLPPAEDAFRRGLYAVADLLLSLSI